MLYESSQASERRVEKLSSLRTVWQYRRTMVDDRKLDFSSNPRVLLDANVDRPVSVLSEGSSYGKNDWIDI